MIVLSASVGFAAANHRNDVIAIQNALNSVPVARGGPESPLQADGIAGPKTKRRIVEFQQAQFHWADGRIDPRGPTLRALNHLLTPSAPSAGVPPLSPAEVRTDRDAPDVAAPSHSDGSIGWVSLQSGECWLRHGAGRTRIEAGRYAIYAGDRVSTEEGRCKVHLIDGTNFSVRPQTLVIIHGLHTPRVRHEGSGTVIRPGSLIGRLRELSGG